MEISNCASEYTADIFKCFRLLVISRILYKVYNGTGKAWTCLRIKIHFVFDVRFEIIDVLINKMEILQIHYTLYSSFI